MPQPPQGGYASYPQSGSSPYGQQGQATNGMAITSLITGILGLFLSFCCIPLGPVALVTGWLGKKKADKSNGQVGGGGMALAGLIMGALGTLIFLVFITLWIVAIASGESYEYQWETG